MTAVLALPTRSLAAFCIMWFTCTRQRSRKRKDDREGGMDREGERENGREGKWKRGREGERARGKDRHEKAHPSVIRLE